MTNQEALDLLQELLPGKTTDASEPYGLLTVHTDANNLLEVVSTLKNDSRFGCTFLTDLCGAHYPDRKGAELEVIYLLHNWVTNFRIRLKVGLGINHPHIPTLVHEFRAANWMERETFDFYGIRFDGHPDLRRILNMDEMNYHPLRKEYPLEDGTRTDKDDRYFGRIGNEGVQFDKH